MKTKLKDVGQLGASGGWGKKLVLVSYPCFLILGQSIVGYLAYNTHGILEGSIECSCVDCGDFLLAVTSVRSPRQVIDALNAEGPDIDIILSEVDLPMSKGYKMLKYIMRDKELRRIPVISKHNLYKL